MMRIFILTGLMLLPTWAWAGSGCGLEVSRLEVSLANLSEAPPLSLPMVLRTAGDSCDSTVTAGCWLVDSAGDLESGLRLTTLGNDISAVDSACTSEVDADLLSWRDDVRSQAVVLRGKLQYLRDTYAEVNP